MRITARSIFPAIILAYVVTAITAIRVDACMPGRTTSAEEKAKDLAKDWPGFNHPLAFKVLIDGELVESYVPTNAYLTREQMRDTNITTCGRPLTAFDTLADRLQIGDGVLQPLGSMLLLGEVHDNATHHLMRSSLLVLFRAVLFEQIRADQQPALDAFAALPPETRATADLTRLLDWDKTSWSKTSNYTPLFDAAVASKLPILAADPPRDLIRAAAKTGPSAIPAEERTRLGLDTPLSDAQNAASLAEIEGSHCGVIPKSAHPNMAFAQRYRDPHLADTLITAAAKHGSAILIAGNGHVRADRGVPWYLRQRAPDKKIISVLFVEVEDGKTDPADYVQRDETGRPIADYLVFTPRAPRDKDPCEEMRAKVPKN